MIRRAMVVLGTRPEVIKLGPVIEELRRRPDRFAITVVTTGQHREVLDQALECFGLVPDASLGIMQEDQSLFDVTTRSLTALKDLLEGCRRPDLLVVQGDTTTAFCAALAAFYCRVPVAHVEAGLRSRDRFNPYPEEINRQMIGTIADWHFAPTARARDNLLAEAVPARRIFVSGNTVVDAVRCVLQRKGPSLPRKVEGLDLEAMGARLLLMTCHRRESFGPDLERIFAAVRRLAEDNHDIVVVYPLHPNPNVLTAARAALAGAERVQLIPPVDYLSFLALMKRAYFVLTDSGGVQEEAPCLGKPLLVMRKVTERPEGVEAGVARLVGTDPDVIVREAQQLLDDPPTYQRMSRAVNPYGDGHAAERIVEILARDPRPG